jgi:hypothetical protein
MLGWHLGIYAAEEGWPLLHAWCFSIVLISGYSNIGLGMAWLAAYLLL